MSRQEATEKILHAKSTRNISFEEIARAVGRNIVWTTAALLGQAAMNKEEAEKVTACLGLPASVAEALQTIPTKGSLDTTVPVDPLIYRFHEITQVTARPSRRSFTRCSATAS